MWKTILNHYRQELVPNLKAARNFSTYWVGFYFIFFYPVLILKKSSIAQLVFYYSVSIPLIILLYATMLFYNRLSKTMFLMPMDEKERKSYVRNQIIIRMTIEAFLFLLGVIIMKIAYPEFQYPIEIIGLPILSCLLEFNIPYDWSFQKKKSSAVTILKLIISMILAVLGSSSWLQFQHNIIVIAVCVVNFIFTIVYCIFGYPVIMREATDYETCYVDKEGEKRR